MQVEIAQDLAFEACNRPNFRVDIDIHTSRGSALLRLGAARHRRPDEIAAIESIAAHRHFVEIVGHPFEPEVRLVAVGKSKHRECAAGKIAVLVEFDITPNGRTVAVESDIVEPYRLAAAH